eukprot:Sspe_Gene.22735::Locus_8694_Transcript_1_1_Confidence_1.000_Length_740::g.22735::m.22735
MANLLDLPYGQLGNIREKAPLNFAVLKLPPPPQRKGVNGTRGTLNVEPTTTFDEAKKGQWGALATTGPMGHRMSLQKPKLRDVSFAKWEVSALPVGCSLSDALNTIADENSNEKRVLKYKIRFQDGSELTFERRDPQRNSTLAYSGYYSPNRAFENLTASAKEGRKNQPNLQFLVNQKGHRIHPGGTKLPPVKRTKADINKIHAPTSQERKALFMQLDPNGNGMLS